MCVSYFCCLSIPLTICILYLSSLQDACHVVMVDEDGMAWSWGNNEFGQLGQVNVTLGFPLICLISISLSRYQKVYLHLNLVLRKQRVQTGILILLTCYLYCSLMRSKRIGAHRTSLSSFFQFCYCVPEICS